MGAEIAMGQFPLVMISHGSGGSNLGHSSIAFAFGEKRLCSWYAIAP